jgi:hypothetical protein
VDFNDFTGLKQTTDDLEERRASVLKPTPQSLTFDNLEGLSPDPALEREVTRQAVTVNPDQFKQKLDASRKTGLPMSVVEQDTGELQNSLRAQELMNKLKDSPYARKWFGLPNNAKVAHDDVDSLTTSEAVAKSAYGQLLTNAFSFNRFVDRVSTTLSVPQDYISENIWAFLFGDEAAKEYRRKVEQRPGLATAILDVGDVIYEALGIRDETAPKTSSYATDPLKAKERAGVTKAVEEKLTSWDSVKDSPVENVLPFIVQQGLISLPDMAMSIASLPAYAAAQTERIAAERAKNDGRTTATFGDFIKALPASTASAILERFGARGMLGLDDALKEISAKGVAQAAGKAAVKEGATEFAQGIIEQAGETIGTKKPFNLVDAVDEAIGGMVAGSGFGGSVRGVTASVEATVKARVAGRRADQLRELNGLNSNLRQRDPELWAEYQAGLMEEYGVDRVRLSDEGINILLQEVDNLPPEQADLFRLPDNIMDGSATGSGADLKPEDFWSLPKETIDKLAEHISFDVNEVSANEAQEIADLTEMATREEFIKEVEQTLGDIPATDALVQEIEGRLMETGGALSGDPAAARAAAQQMSAVFSTMARRTGVPLETIQRRFLPRIERVTGAGLRPSATTLEQAQQGFADPRIPELEQAARDRSEGRITQEQYQAVVDQYKPVLPYESVPEPATEAAMRGALASNKVGRLGKGGEFVGQAVGLRLDIPAYTQKGVWVPTIHNPQGKPVAHEAAARITNATFTEPGAAAETAAGKVGRGEKGKAPFAQINGTLESVDPAELKAAADAALNDPAWTQVGYDPRRHTFFYDRKTQQPVLAADEVIQVGPLVLAKNAQFGDAGTFLFQEGAADVQSAQALLASDPEALGLTPDLVSSVNPIYRPQVIPARKMAGNKAVAKWLEDAFTGDAITDMTATLTDAQIERVATLIAAEAQLALQNSGNAFDWYSAALDRAIDVVKVKYPMVADDAAAAEAGFGTAKNARFVFTYIMAVTSQNLDVQSNTVATDKIFGQMLERVKAGNFTMDKSWGTGDKQKAMGENFAKFGPLIQAMEGADFPAKLSALDDLFRDKRTVTQWVADMKAAGIPYSKPGQTAMSAEVYGSSLLGPKIGNGFWQNLNGNFDPLTIDLWMRRTWGRLTGKSIGNPEALPGQRKRLKDAVARSRSNQYGAPDLIAEMKNRVSYLDDYIAALGDPERVSWLGDKKSLSAHIRELKAERKGLAEALPDLEGIQAPEPWKASYGRNEAELLAYAKRLLKVWDAEYKRLREAYTTIPDGLQPTWARAAKTIITNLAKPLDQVNNGTQRIQIERAGQRAKEILRGRGIELTTADLQAVLWYPEKELWNALGTRLEVDADGSPVIPPSSLNESYDTTFARILRSQGYDIQGTERAEGAGTGRGAVVGRDAGLEQPEGVGGAGQAREAGAGTGTLLQEVDFVGDVIFEVAPDPNNVELSSRWNALPAEVKLSISDAVSKSVLPSVLRAAGADGSVFSQIGSYLNDTNPSFSLRLTSGDPAAVARAVGFVLSQDSMVALSADAFDGSFEAGAIRIQVGDKNLQEIDAIYQTLRGIEGFPQIGGQSTTDGQMTLILEDGVDPDSFAAAVDAALSSEYDVEVGNVQAAFPEKKDYDYARETDDPAGSEGVARQRYRAVRDQASREVAAAIDRYEQGGQQPALAQQQEGVTARGSIDIGTAEGIVIRLYDAENLSTFLHESGHLYLEMLGAFAEDADAPQQIKDDFSIVLKWLGVGSRAEIGREQHERWAETYEAYLREGKAPSEELRSAFAKFTAWLTTLYRRIRRAGSLPRAALNKDISDVMDRLLASDEQIAVVRDEMRMAPMFKDAEAAGMTDAEFSQYKADYEAAREAQQDELTQAALSEVRRERTKWWNEELDRESGRILTALNEDPVWRARAIIQQGALPNGDPLPEVYPARLKLDKKMTAEYGYDLPGGNQLFARDGVNPERAAQDLGYSSADQMLRELSELPKSADGKFLTAKQFADAQAREYMLQHHGDLMDADQMHEEALNKVHSRRQAQIILDELRLLNRKAGRTNQISNRAARTAAENTMREKTIAQLGSPTKYLNAERRFAMKAAEAVISGDIDAALRFKTQQLLNFHMYRQARDLRSKADSMIARMADYSRRKFDPTKMHPEYIQQVKALLGDINFSGKMSARRFATLSSETLQQWADQQSEKFGASFHISPELDRALTKQNVRDFTFVELEGMHDTARSLVTQGRRYSDAETAQFNQMTRNMGYSIDANATKDIRAGRERTKWDSVKGFVRLAFAEHRTILSLSEELDGYERGGPVYTEVYQRIKRADDSYIDRSMKAAKAINDILSAYTRRERLSFFRKTRVPELNDSLSLNARLAFALNMGNPGNVSALKEEYTDAQIDGVLATLTDKDWDVVERIWEYVDTYWDDLSALEKRTTGVAPAKVSPSPFTLPSGRVIKGGYYPLVADPNRSVRGKEDYDASHSLKAFSSGGRVKTSTKHGSTIERKGFGDKPVWLDLRVLFEHVDGVIRDIEMREAVADTVRIIRSKPFSDAVTRAKGSEFYSMFQNWLEHTVEASKPPTTTVEKVFQYLRTGSSIAEMGLSVRTALMQPFGYTSSIALIGEKYAAKGMLKFTAQRGRAAQEVMEASAFMRNRAATFNREVREANRWLGTDSLKNDLVTASFWGIQKLDMAVSIPTWLGAYDKAKDEGMSHDDAVDYADDTVSRTQGSGLPRNMADIQQGPVWKKMFTMFYSYFGAYQNMQTDLWKQTSFRNPAQALKYAKAQIWLTVVPSLLVDALFNELFGGDDDDEIYEKMASSLLRQMTGGVVFLRDAVNAVTTGFNYQSTPAGNPIKELANLTKQIGQNEVDAALVKSLIMTTGYMLHIPGARAGARATSVLMDDGDTFEFDEFESWWRLLVTGPKRD